MPLLPRSFLMRLLSKADHQHAMFMQLTRNRLALAPIDQIPLHDVLDIVTGTGIWAIEFAEAHPSAQVIGTDLSPIQPTDVPPNCSFEVDDAEDEWLFKKPFSYIHARAIISCFKDFPFVIRSAYKALLPGGILELQDPIFPLVFDKPYPPPDSPFVHFQKLIVEGTTKSGRPWAKSSQYKGWMEDSGFVNVHEEKFFLPVGSWCEGPKLRNIGAYYLTNWLEAFDAGTPRILSNLGWEVEESKILVAQVRDEFLKSNLRAYTHFWCVWVRKSELRAEAEAGGVAGAA